LPANREQAKRASATSIGKSVVPSHLQDHTLGCVHERHGHYRATALASAHSVTTTKQATQHPSGALADVSVQWFVALSALVFDMNENEFNYIGNHRIKVSFLSNDND
jgi:hypothetical protein